MGFEVTVEPSESPGEVAILLSNGSINVILRI